MTEPRLTTGSIDVPARVRGLVSAKAETFTESVIREMTRLCAASTTRVNLAQGFPDFACPPELKEAAKAAIDADVNQYAITWGARDVPGTRSPTKVGRTYPGWDVDPETRDLRHLRLDRGDDRDDARAGRPRRRGDRLRAVLRELRARRDPVRRRRRAT